MSSERENDERGIVYREFDTDQADPNVSVAEVVADLEGVDTGDLSPLYACIDNILDRLFSNPPSPDAETQISFSYEGYRITVDQNGSATFLKLGESESPPKTDADTTDADRT